MINKKHLATKAINGDELAFEELLPTNAPTTPAKTATKNKDSITIDVK